MSTDPTDLPGAVPDRRFVAACAALAVALLAVYSNSFRGPFHFDDWHTIEQNLYIRDLGNLRRFFTDAQTFSALPSNQSYRPLVTTTLAIDYRLGGGLAPVAFHVDNFLVFALTCCFLVLLFRRALGNRWMALFGAALFGLHAATAETVNYIIARSDLLSTLGAVATILVYSSSPRARRLHLYLIPAVLGTLAKEQGAMTAPLLVLWIGFVEQGLSLRELLTPRKLWGALRPALPAFVVLGGLVAMGMRMATNFTPGGSSRLFYLATQPYVLLHYAAMFLWPSQLSADTDWTLVTSASDPRLWVGLLFVAAALFAAARLSRSEKTRPAALGLLWFFVALVPTSSVIPLSEVTNDHRMYFPLVGLTLAAACVSGVLLQAFAARIERSRLSRAIPIALAALILGGLGWAAHARNQVWSTEETLWRDVTEKSPDNGRGWMNYGLARMAKGDYDEAERCFRRGLERAPYYGYLHTNLAIVAAARGKPAEAEREFREGVRLMPSAPTLRYYFARWLHKISRDAEAAGQLRQSLALSPGDSSARQLFLEVLAAQRSWGELAGAAREALRLNSRDTTARSMLSLAEGQLSGALKNAQSPEALVEQSLADYRAGRYEAALVACDGALALRPDYAEAFNNKCAAFNMLKRFREAEAACERAVQLKPDFALAQNNLAVARAGAQ